MTIKALCITEDPDRPTTATLAGLQSRRRGCDGRVPALGDAGTRRAGRSWRAPTRHRARAAVSTSPASAGCAPSSSPARYDILHLFSNKALQNGLIAARRLPVRIIAYRGIVGNVSFFSPVSWLRVLNPRIDRIVCVAEAVRGYFLQMRPAFLRVPPTRLVTIYKGHSLDWYTRGARGFAVARHPGGRVRGRLRGQLSAPQGHRVSRRRVGGAAEGLAGASIAGRAHGGHPTRSGDRGEPSPRPHPQSRASDGRAGDDGRLRRVRAAIREARGACALVDRGDGLR